MPPSAPKTGVRVRDKFLNCDFPTVGQMVDFAHHPFMAQVSRETLEPLYQFFLRIRALAVIYRLKHMALASGSFA
jgi:hypothetical protein